MMEAVNAPENDIAPEPERDILYYRSIIDVSRTTLLRETLMAYYARINADQAAYRAIPWIYFALLAINIVFSPLYVDNSSVWTTDSNIHVIANVISIVYEGPFINTSKARQVTSTVVCFIFAAFFVVISWRVMAFDYKKNIRKEEILSVLIISKYLMPYLSQLLVCGLPHAICSVFVLSDYSFLGIFTIICAPSLFIVFTVFMFKYISVRVMLEDSVICDWFSLFPPIAMLSSSFSTIVSVSIGISPISVKATLCFMQIVVSGAISVELFRMSSIITRRGNILVASLYSTSSITCIFQFINFFCSAFGPTSIIIIAVAAFVSSIVIFSIIASKRLTKTLIFFDQCSEDRTETEEMMDIRYTKSIDLYTDIRVAFEEMHPFVISMFPLMFGVAKFPKSAQMVTMLIRILAIFPNRTSDLVKNVVLISNVKTFFSIKEFILQVDRIEMERKTTMTPEINDYLESINHQIELTTIHLRRFWEGVMQRNTESFWDNALSYIEENESIETKFDEMRQKYPNQKGILKRYISFCDEMLKDESRSRTLKSFLSTLCDERITYMDKSARNAVTVFPNLFDAVNDYQLETEELSDETDTSPYENSDQFAFAFDQLLKRSKLGNIWICLIFILISTASICIFYAFYISVFETDIVDDCESQLNAVHLWSELKYRISYLTIIVNAYPIVMSDTISFDDTFISAVSPSLFSQSAIPNFQITSANITNVSQRVSLILEQFSILSSKLSDSHTTWKSIRSQIFSNTTWNSSTIQTIVLDIVIAANSIADTNNATEMYDAEYLPRYNSLFSIFEEGYSGVNLTTDADGGFSSVPDTMMVTGAIFSILLITLPFMLQLFKLLIQVDAINRSFTLIPNAEIRGIISTFGEQSKIDEDSTWIAELGSTAKSNVKSALALASIIFSSFVPFLGASLAVYYQKQSLENSLSGYFSNMLSIYPALGEEKAAFSFMIRAFSSISYTGDNSFGSLLNSSEDRLNSAMSMLSSSCFSRESSIDMYYSSLSLFKNYTKYLLDSSNNVRKDLTAFERISLYPYLDSTDVIDKLFITSLNEYKSDTSIMANDTNFLSLLYNYVTFSVDGRDELFVSVVSSWILTNVEAISSYNFYVEIAIIVWQCVSLIFSVFFLENQSKKIKAVAKLYKFIPNDILVGHTSILRLIETGIAPPEQRENSFADSDYVLSKLQQGIVVIDRDFIISDYNANFSEIAEEETFELLLKGKKLCTVFKEHGDEKQLLRLLKDLDLALKGLIPLSYSSQIIVETKNGKVELLGVSALFMTEMGAASDEDISKIQTIVLLIDNETDVYERDQIVKAEQYKVTKMLRNVMPDSIISQLEKGCSTVAFISQSCSIGLIRVTSSEQWNYTDDTAFKFFNQVFSSFDEEILSFPAIVKVRTMSHTYMYAAGLLGQNVRPREHAEQAVQFALKTLEKRRGLEKVMKEKISLTIGIHTGGPVIAGVMSMDRPAFQVISPVINITSQLKSTAASNTIHISRAVYELVYSAGFNIKERGDFTLKSGERFSSYVVSERL